MIMLSYVLRATADETAGSVARETILRATGKATVRTAGRTTRDKVQLRGHAI